MPLAHVTKEGRSLFVDKDSDHHKKLLDEGFSDAEMPETDSAAGQGVVPSPIRPALPHPAHPHSLNTSGDPEAAAVADRIRIEHEMDRSLAVRQAEAQNEADRLQAEADAKKAIKDAAEARVAHRKGVKEKDARVRAKAARKEDDKPVVPPGRQGEKPSVPDKTTNK